MQQTLFNVFLHSHTGCLVKDKDYHQNSKLVSKILGFFRFFYLLSILITALRCANELLLDVDEFDIVLDDLNFDIFIFCL